MIKDVAKTDTFCFCFTQTMLSYHNRNFLNTINTSVTLFPFLIKGIPMLAIQYFSLKRAFWSLLTCTERFCLIWMTHTVHCHMHQLCPATYKDRLQYCASQLKNGTSIKSSNTISFGYVTSDAFCSITG